MNIFARISFLICALNGAVVVSLISEPLDSLKQSLPEENESFESIRRNNKTYVDKTSFLISLLNRKGPFFYVMRPQRFGKSTFLQMMQKFFLGEEHLFENLAIHSYGNTEDGKNGTWLKYPVIYLDFNSSKYITTKKKEEFQASLCKELTLVGQSYGIDITDPTLQLDSLIDHLHKKFNLSVIILIDDYDAPLRHTKNSELVEGIRDTLWTIFSNIEARGDYVRLTFATGVLRPAFGKEWDDLTTLVDVTNNKELATAFGFSKQEITAYFEPHIKELINSTDRTRKDIMKDLIDWYGGYRFSTHESSKLLNPTSAIKSFYKRQFNNFWCGDSFIGQVFDEFSRNRDMIDYFEDYTIKGSSLFQKYNKQGQNIPWYILLLFTGYLTIKSYDQEKDKYVLAFPNRETRETLSNQLCSYVASKKKSIFELPEWTAPVKEAMKNGNIPLFMKSLSHFDFPIWDLDKTPNVRGLGRMRTLLRIFDAAGIKYELGKENWHQFHLDLQTLQLPINYVFEIRAMEQALEAIYQLCDYILRRMDFFKNAINFQNEVYLLAIDFTVWGTDEIGDWISIPYKHGELKLDQVLASRKHLADNFVFRLRNRPNVTVTPRYANPANQ